MDGAMDYWGFRITYVLAEGGWHWRISRTSGALTTSTEIYDTPALALAAGKDWIVTTTLQNSLKRCLSELLMRNVLQDQEYENLMRSLLTGWA
jgi:hypothetical protein